MKYLLLPPRNLISEISILSVFEFVFNCLQKIQFPGVYSPPQTPGTKIEKANPLEIARPETPPPSTHRLEIPDSPETPTRPPVNNGGGASLFDDNNQLSQPTTPVLYNLIRNEGPPKFVITSKTAEQPVVKESELSDGIHHFWVELIL
jgi:hypothetical protein